MHVIFQIKQLKGKNRVIYVDCEKPNAQKVQEWCDF